MTAEPLPFRFHVPVEILFGAGQLQMLRDAAAGLGERPLVVTGSGSARKNGALEAVQAQYRNAVLCEGVPENPTTGDCDKAAAQCRDAGCDMVIAIGGGSPIDVAKAAAGLARNPGHCVDYYGGDKFTAGVLPIIAVPTTAGAGSEVTPYSVIIDAESGEKRTISGKDLFPKIAVVDPLLTHTLPPTVTAHTGLDALSQAMEGMVSKKATAMGDLLALEAIRLIVRWLPVAVHEGQNAEARANMHYAALLAGCVVALSQTTLVHGMGYPLTTRWNIAHGLANALLLPPLFAHNAQYAPATVARIAEAMGKSCQPDPDHAGTAVRVALAELMSAVGVSPAARDHGMDAKAIPELASAIAANPYRFRNQIGDIDEARITQFYEAAYEGT